MHFKFHFVYGIVCLSPHKCGTLFKLPGFNCVSLVASPPLEISSYTTSWKPYYKNPGYAPVYGVIEIF